ncbi:MAG: hypothetical protein KOO62_10795 [candidate division Zixibacteria bacterium]|nr:hypothetical protein [candidate division Zixibacteria bacterium]
MKSQTLRLYTIILMLLIGVTSYGASRIVIEPVTGMYNDSTVLAGCSVKFLARLTNTGGNTITALTNGFRIYTHDYGSYTNGFTPVKSDLLNVGIETMLDGGFFINHFSVNGIGADTIGFGGFKLFGTGIPDGFDNWMYWIETTPLNHGDVLCIDSSWYPPGGAWSWSTTPGGLVIPEWSGPYCYDVFLCPCGRVNLSYTPSSMSFGSCSTAEFFISGGNIDIPEYPVHFSVIYGPGIMIQLDDTSAIWTYQPTAADIGNPQTVKVEGYSEGSCTSTLITVNFYAEPLDLVSGCNDTVQIDAGELVTHRLTACAVANFYIADINPTPNGSLDMNYSSGLITFSSAPDDRGMFVVEGCATDNTDTVCCPVVFFVSSDVCLNRGNVDGIIGDGGPVDIADLTYLVAYLFNGGSPPPCQDEGNVDAVAGSGGPINIADLTYLVAYLFTSGPPPPPCPN